MTGFQWLGFDSSRNLSTEETLALAARVAELTRAGLPLGAGLRALAGELPGQRLPRVLRAMADQLDAGADLTVAIEAQGRRLPTCLRGLVLAGIRSGRLAEVLEEYVDLQRSQLELRQRVWFSLAYPLLLLVLMTAILVFANLIIVRSFEKVFMDFKLPLPSATVWALRGMRPLIGFLVVVIGLVAAVPLMFWWAPRVCWVWPVLHRLPMVGSLLRWSHLSQFTRLMSLLLEQQVPVPDALRLTAAGLPDASLARGCRRAADDVERGRSLCESLAARRPFPPSLVSMLEWGQHSPALSEAFRAATEMFEGRVRSQGALLESVLLPIMLLTVLCFVGFFVIAMFLPLVTLITKLSK